MSIRSGIDPTTTARAQALHRRHPGLVLAVILTCQLMVVLDATIVNIALPNIRDALGFSTTNLSWVINAYTLTFGGLLLLGARTGDIVGRRTTFVWGIALFTAASLLGGFSQNPAELLVARAAQGVGGAFASPAALALLMTMFTEGRERTRAIGLYTAVSVGGSAVGLIAGGVLTQLVSWRWVLFVNVPIGIVVVLLARLVIQETPRHRGALRPPRRAHLHARHGVAGLRLRPRGDRRLERLRDDRRLHDRRRSAHRVRLHRAPGDVADHAAAAVRRPQPRQLLRRPPAAGRRDDGDVLLPHPVPAERPRLQPDPHRPRVPADHRPAVRRVAGELEGADRAVRRAATDDHRRLAVRARACSG